MSAPASSSTHTHDTAAVQLTDAEKAEKELQSLCDAIIGAVKIQTAKKLYDSAWAVYDIEGAEFKRVNAAWGSRWRAEEVKMENIPNKLTGETKAEISAACIANGGNMTGAEMLQPLKDIGAITSEGAAIPFNSLSKEKQVAAIKYLRGRTSFHIDMATDGAVSAFIKSVYAASDERPEVRHNTYSANSIELFTRSRLDLNSAFSADDDRSLVLSLFSSLFPLC